MSWRSSSLVFERSRAKGSNRLMLLAIADYAKDNGKWAFASARTLTAKCQLSGRGGELVLIRLVHDGEIMAELKDGLLYLHIRCIFDWEAYRTEGTAPAIGEIFSRKQREIFSRKLVAIATTKANARAAKAKSTTAKAKTGESSLCTGSERDPTGSEEQGLRPDHHPVETVENPEDNIRVIAKIAHQVIELYADSDDVEDGDVIESMKRHCAALNIAYCSNVIWRALDSAVKQRQRLGKPTHRRDPNDQRR